MQKHLSELLLCSLIATVTISCQKSEDPVDEPVVQTEPVLTGLDLELAQSIFHTKISGNTVTLDRDFPFGTSSVSVNAISAKPDNTVSLTAGTLLDPRKGSVLIDVRNSRSGKTAQYTLNLRNRSWTDIVSRHGLLQVKGNRIVNRSGEVISLAGNSFFWSNQGWGGERFYNPAVVSWLALDWESTIVRASMGVDESVGYLQDKPGNLNKIKTIVDAAISNGLYVLIDWHSHHAEDYTAEAVSFFSEMARLYGDTENVMYEIYNEPLNISWSGKIKPYAESVIAAIRAHDPDNMIIVGTPEWSQQVDKPANDPITTSTNIAYTLHFYTKFHQQWLRDRATAALAKGIALFITEWGSIGYTQQDPETDKWMQWCRDNQITHCNWSVNDKAEEWSIVPAGANPNGGWQTLTGAGYLARDIIRSWPR